VPTDEKFVLLLTALVADNQSVRSKGDLHHSYSIFVFNGNALQAQQIAVTNRHDEWQ
jgi:hypothetical protein